MNKKIERFLLSLTFSFFLATSSVFSDTGPEIFVPKSVFEFGTVFEGDKVIHEFELFNKGDTLLDIQRIVPACGCTATSLSKNKIKPSESAKIKVQFNTQGFSGSKVKSVKLYTNDPKNSNIVLTLKGAIQKNVTISPSRLEFINLVQGSDYSQQTKKVRITTRAGSSVKIRNIVSLAEKIKVIEKKTDKGYELLVSIDNSVSEGELRERIVVQLNGAKYKAINIPVYVKIKPKFEFSQKTLSFGVLKKGKSYKRGIRLINNTGEAFNVKLISKFPKGLSAKVLKLDDKNSMVSVTLNPDMISKDLKSEVRVAVTSKGKDQKVSKVKELAFNVFAFTK